jgi:predicted permease
MTRIRDALAVEHPRWFADRGVAVRPLQDAIVGSAVRSWMLLLLAAVGFVLLIACLNVANLLLARAAARQREIAVRAALGATRWDLARALLVESLMLAMLGAASGILVAFWGVRVLRATLPEHLPRLATAALDLRVLGVAALAAVATGVLFGTLPALRLSRPDVAAGLRLGGRTQAGGSTGDRLRTWLVTSEVALAVVLLAGAGLFISSFMRVARIDIGLDPEHVVAVGVSPRPATPPRDRRAEIASAHPLILAALERAKAVPGVVSAAALTSGLPLSGNSMTVPVQLPGREAPPFTDRDEAYVHGVTAEYLEVMRSTLVRGRWITAQDTAGSPPVVVLSDEAVRRYFGTRDPLGTLIILNDAPYTVVGIVRGVRIGGPESDLPPEAYIPFLRAISAAPTSWSAPGPIRG